MGRKPTKKKGKKIKRPPWPEDKTNKLIENYEEETVLYVKSARGYSNRDLREATYKKIGEKFDVTGNLPIIARTEYRLCMMKMFDCFWFTIPNKNDGCRM